MNRLPVLSVHRLNAPPANWNELVGAYPNKTVFHESAWLAHVHSIHPDGRIEYFEIRDGDTVVGHHCGLRIHLMGVSIHGSPLGGTGTNHMGPLMHDLSPDYQREVLRALKRDVLGLTGAWHIEVSNPALRRDVAEAEGFAVHEGITHLLHLPADTEEAWAFLRSSCRNRVRKAEKAGLVAERTDDPAVVDQFFEQFTEVYAKQDMVTPFGKDRPTSLFESLLPAGRLLALRVTLDNDVLATGLFPFDEHCIYFWGAASWLKYQKLCPNELLHWTVIKFAAENSIPLYDMCGGQSQFKDKFGGDDVPYLHYSRSAIPGMLTARKLYRQMHFWRLKHS